MHNFTIFYVWLYWISIYIKIKIKIINLYFKKNSFLQINVISKFIHYYKYFKYEGLKDNILWIIMYIIHILYYIIINDYVCSACIRAINAARWASRTTSGHFFFCINLQSLNNPSCLGSPWVPSLKVIKPKIIT